MQGVCWEMAENESENGATWLVSREIKIDVPTDSALERWVRTRGD